MSRAIKQPDLMPNSKYRQWKWNVLEPHARADRAILDALSQTDIALTRNQLQKLMNEGHVTANGIAIRPGAKLSGDEEVVVHIPEPKPMEITPEDRPLDILFEDDHLIVINKPQGLTVHPSATQHEGTLVHALLHKVKDLSGIGGVLRPGIVHRIDKNTSGALVITKTDAAHQGLAETFATHSIERVYWALCYGSPPTQERVRIESLIGRSSSDRKKMSMQVKEGRQAITYYRRLENYGPLSGGFASLLEVTLETGRTHQIRVHLTGAGYSVLGDPTYGLPTSSHPKWRALPKSVQPLVQALPGQALHARVLGFKHPITGQALRWEAPPPVAFEILRDTLQKWR